MSQGPDLADVQALVGSGFGTLSGARYWLLRVTDAPAARDWLSRLSIASMADAKMRRLPRVCQLALTAAGLRALGLPVDAIPGFAPEFLDGMASDERRSARLGDEGGNAPAHWHWGIGEREPHLLLILLAHDADIAAFEAETLASMPAGALDMICANRGSGAVAREPFGFTDGISQPALDWDGTLKPGGAKDRIYRNSLALGDVLLGHSNEYGFVTHYPEADGLGRNGSYLVYRQLGQDVTGFWQWLAGEAGEAGADGAMALAQQMVGRGMDGAPLPGLDRGPVRGETGTRNDFTYAGDPDGMICPIGAHVRRANPRSGDDPQGRRGFFRDIISSLGLKGSAMHDAVASARFHRILRRGRAYGASISPQDAMRGIQPAEETGLHFICLNASLARQFEFVQGSWIATPYFAGLSGEQDPLLGSRCPVAGGGASDAFSHWESGVGGPDGDGRNGNPRLRSGLPQFVTVKGGAYFFLPGLRGLKRILGRWPESASG